MSYHPPLKKTDRFQLEICPSFSLCCLNTQAGRQPRISIDLQAIPLLVSFQHASIHAQFWRGLVFLLDSTFFVITSATLSVSK